MKKLILILTMALCLCSPLYAKTVDLSGGGTKTTSGTVTAGCRGITFIFSADFTGTVAGKTFAGATDYSYSPPIQTGDTLAAIAYVVTTGNVRIVEVR
jgi:hypothetical protein